MGEDLVAAFVLAAYAFGLIGGVLLGYARGVAAGMRRPRP